MSEAVGVRLLRQNLSRYLDRVEAGEELVVTEHGREVARLVPVERSPYAELAERSGRRSPRSAWRTSRPAGDPRGTGRVRPPRGQSAAPRRAPAARAPSRRARRGRRAARGHRAPALDEDLLAEAEPVPPTTVHTLDAIHLATALRLARADALDAVMTYDARLAAAAREHGLTVLAPT